MKKWVYAFSRGFAEGNASMDGLLGHKGANLAEISLLGLPVPPGFTISSEVRDWHRTNNSPFPETLHDQVNHAIDQICAVTKCEFGKGKKPLLLALRSGSRMTVPGMMDTVLNLGLNDETAKSLAKETGDECFALDNYRRFIQTYCVVVLGMDYAIFEEVLDAAKPRFALERETDFSAEHWRVIIAQYKHLIEDERGLPFPQDANEQLWGAIEAVFSCWSNCHATNYRALHNISEHWGNSINVQAMVFGNMDNSSAVGRAFTRNPFSGKNELYGEYLTNAQGEDFTAGVRALQNLTEKGRTSASSEKKSLEKSMPKVFTQLNEIANRLEASFRDMQEMEFVIEHGELWILRTRPGKRTTKAALRAAIDMANEGLISREEAICLINPDSLNQLLHPTIASSIKNKAITKGLPASPGAAVGRLAFNSRQAEKYKNGPVILVRIETGPDDIPGMHIAKGILTTRGGMTSHAAVIARGMGKPCVSSVNNMSIDYQSSELRILDKVFKTGDTIAIDGSSGQVFANAVALRQPELSGAFATLMKWADDIRRMQVRANAEVPGEAAIARSFGAQGIGLCRTEHMFFEAGRIAIMREMVLAKNERERRDALDKLLPLQRSDFIELFKIMSGQPVTIRLLDAPLHEFLPGQAEEIAEVSRIMGIDEETLRRRTESLFEFNPMLGHRGCRLAISYPEITEMQTRAIFEAAIEAGEKTGSIVVPEIMVPLVSMNRELEFIKGCIDKVAATIRQEKGVAFKYIVGTMIELPRAAIMADKIAKTAEFFSFGTNDLTQSIFGMSRDDASSYLPDYERKGIVKRDPFVSLDLDGVGEAMRIAAQKGRASRPDIKISICGEHGGDAASIFFCESLGLDYISCSAFRVPIARLAAAQAAIKYRK